MKTQYLIGDCLDIIKEHIYDESINLIMTSPPYADRRPQYSNIKPEEYIDWFLLRSEQFKRILSEDGSFILNIKEHSENGQRNLYVYKLIIDLVEKQGWKLIDDYIWRKTSAAPGFWQNKLRDAWEHCYHLSKISPGIKMFQDAVKVPAKDWSKDKNFGKRKEDLQRRNSNTGSKIGTTRANWAGKTHVLPDNVIEASVATSHQNNIHPAVFPKVLPRFFIKLFTEEGDTILDPFAGSGTTLNEAISLNRNAIGIDIRDDYEKLFSDKRQTSIFELIE